MSLLYSSLRLFTENLNDLLSEPAVQKSQEFVQKYEKLCRIINYLSSICSFGDDDEQVNLALNLLRSKMTVLLKNAGSQSESKGSSQKIKYFNKADFEGCKFIADSSLYDFKNVAGNERAVNSLKEIENSINETRQNGLNDDQTFRYLMYGPAGTGKTFMAKCLGSMLRKHNIDMYIIDASDLKGSYVGQTEKNISNMFDIIEQRKAGFVFILLDEIETMFDSGRGGAESIFKARMQERPATKVTPIFIAATNYIDKIPGAIKSRMEPIFIDVLKGEGLKDKLKLDFTKNFILHRGSFSELRSELHIDQYKDIHVDTFFWGLSYLLAGFSGRDINTLIRNIKNAQSRRLKSKILYLVEINDVKYYDGMYAMYLDDMKPTSYFFNKRSSEADPAKNLIVLTPDEKLLLVGENDDLILKEGSWPDLKKYVMEQTESIRMFPMTLIFDDIVYYAGVMNGPTVPGKEYNASKSAGDEKGDDAGLYLAYPDSNVLEPWQESDFNGGGYGDIEYVESDD